MKTPFFPIAGSVLAVSLTLAGHQAMAHPSFVNGGVPNIKWNNNTPTAYQKLEDSRMRGYWIDAIRIGHGCNLDGSEDGANDDPVVANSWIWPQGNSGYAPMSTGCDSAGKNCTGGATQPSVQQIPDSTKKASDASGKGLGPATSLAAELVGGDTVCVTDPTTHRQTCDSKPGNAAINSVGGRMQFLGNLGYFKKNEVKKNADGFYAKGNRFNAEQIKAMGIGSAGSPYHNAIQVLWAETQDTSKVAPFYFSANSCARKLVIRPAGADLCKLKASVKAYNKDPHLGNFWFGGPTPKFQDGHGIHENFWMNYTLMTRDTSVNPYGANCADPVNGDYDLVVMPTIEEIDNGLPFKGFATRK